LATPTSTTPWNYTTLTGIASIDSLLGGTQWAPSTLTYSFASPGSYWSTSSTIGYGPSTGDGEPWAAAFDYLTASDQAAVRSALATWSSVANLTFAEVADSSTTAGDLRFAYSYVGPDSGQAWAYLPGRSAYAGDIWFNARATSYTKLWTAGSYPYETVIHEIGHALGLKHPFDSKALSPGTLDPALDSRSFTIMSYSADPGDKTTDFSNRPTTPMFLDVLAIQQMYGANMTTGAGNTTYTFSGTSSYHQTIWDAGGTDTFVYYSSLGGEIDLNEGIGGGSMLGLPVNALDSMGRILYQVYNVFIAYGTVIENATGGSGNDLIIGNDVANSLNGSAGNDTLKGEAGNDSLNGGVGADTMLGGAGNDSYVVDNASDRVYETTTVGGTTNAGGTDTIRSSVSFTLGSFVEKLVLTGSAAINGTGNSLANSLTGNAAANTLNGGGGADTLLGGAGNDTYVVDNVGDKVYETTTVGGATNAGGTDTVRSSVSYTLGSFVERLVLTGSAAINGTGNALANSLTGNAAANTLNGGSGADTLLGGAGNDTYVVDNAGDRVYESTTVGGTTNAGGTDTVRSSVSYTLGGFVERLVLTGSAAINGTGNALANSLTGNAAANMLNGGSGNDTLVGAAGDDKLTGGAGSDRFVFNSKLGSDIVTDFLTGTDMLGFSQAALKIGDGDTVVEGATVRALPGGFSASSELVIFSTNVGSLTASAAAATIGSATSAYTMGKTALFSVDNGASSALYLFNAADSNAEVSASELTLLATLNGTSATAIGDYLFLS
jgi:Ca2+-binding RTX toxin-like protein